MCLLQPKPPGKLPLLHRFVEAPPVHTKPKNSQEQTDHVEPQWSLQFS